MERFSNVLQKGLILWLVGLSAVALLWPEQSADAVDSQSVEKDESLATSKPFDPFLVTKPILNYLFAVTMFCIGCLLPREEVDELRRRWPTVLGGTAIQYTTMPLLAWSVGQFFGLEGPYLIGVIVVGCVPGAMASNVITLAAKGNVSYSVSLTTMATLISPFVVPWILKLTLSQEKELDAIAVMVRLLWQVVGPVIAGHVICRLIPEFAHRVRFVAPAFANLTIIWIIAVVVAMNRVRLTSVFDSTESTAALLMLGAVIAINLLGYLAGFSGGTLLSLPDDMRRALTLEVGMQNAGLGTLLVADLFKEEPAAAIPTALYTFGCMLTGTLLAQWWSWKRPPQNLSAAADSGHNKPLES